MSIEPVNIPGDDEPPPSFWRVLVVVVLSCACGGLLSWCSRGGA